MIKDRLLSLNIEIPEAPSPVGSYVAYKIVGKLIYISGQLPINKGNILKGKVGKDLSVEEGQKAAHLCCLNILSQLKLACENDLEKIKGCIKITGFVNSTNDFIDQPKIINPVSDLISKIFEENGKHTRAAVSVNSLPLGSAVEVDAIFELK